MEILSMILSQWLRLILVKPRSLRFLFPWILWLFQINFFGERASKFVDKGIPFINFEAIEWLESFLNNKDKIVFEYGSGGSTIFIAKRAKRLISVEHDLNWYLLVSQKLKDLGIKECSLLLRQPENLRNSKDSNDPEAYLSGVEDYRNVSFKSYAKAIENFPDGFFDLVFIDGRARPSCILEAMSKVRPGGFILLDNSDRTRYSKGKELLRNWRKRIFFGPVPGTLIFVEATLYQKP